MTHKTSVASLVPYTTTEWSAGFGTGDVIHMWRQPVASNERRLSADYGVVPIPLSPIAPLARAARTAAGGTPTDSLRRVRHRPGTKSDRISHLRTCCLRSRPLQAVSIKARPCRAFSHNSHTPFKSACRPQVSEISTGRRDASSARAVQRLQGRRNGQEHPACGRCCRTPGKNPAQRLGGTGVMEGGTTQRPRLRTSLPPSGTPQWSGVTSLRILLPCMHGKIRASWGEAGCDGVWWRRPVGQRHPGEDVDAGQ